MRLYHLGYVSWLESQLIYHAQARLGLEGLNLLAPREAYVCIGYHQDVAQEVDVAYCQEHAIPIFRREVGGGAVYLDGNQLFYQLILHKDNPLAQGDKATFYQRLLQPVAEAYGDLGVPARYRPINDVVTLEGRKISGTGAAEIGDCLVLVGNLIADFDYQTMARVLRVPDEKFRDKVFQSMQENLTTLRRELGRVPSWEEMSGALMQRFEGVLGPLEPAELPEAVYEEMERLKPRFLSAEWLHKKGRKQAGREVKIAGEVHVVQRVYKAPGGLLRATLELKEGRIASVALSGDFFAYPPDAVAELEGALEGLPLAEVAQAVVRFYATQPIETPGVSPGDWQRVLLGA